MWVDVFLFFLLQLLGVEYEQSLSNSWDHILLGTYYD